MSKRVQITFTEEEYHRIEVEAARVKVPVNQYCKDIILATDLSSVKSKSGSFTKNHAKLLSEIKAYAASHCGTFQLRDLKCWGRVKQATFDGEEIFPASQRPALGRAIAKDIENGLVPGVRIATTIKNGMTVPKMDKYGVIIYEIDSTDDGGRALDPDYTIEEDSETNV